MPSMTTTRDTLFDTKSSCPRKTSTPQAAGDQDLVFQVVSWYATDVDDAAIASAATEDFDEEDDADAAILRSSAYVVKMFGVTPDGRSVAVTARGFPPYFFVKVPPCMRRTTRDLTRTLPDALRELADNEYKCCRRKRGSLLDAKVVWRTNFWGFSAGKREPYLRLTFRRDAARRGMANYLSNNAVKLRGAGPTKLELFEANIDPLLRFIHARDIQGAGWITVPAAALRARHQTLASSNLLRDDCDNSRRGDDDDDYGRERKKQSCEILPATEHVGLDVSVRWTDVFPVRDGREDIAPLLIASFDIECNSSHGDMSVAVKSYKRVAADLVRYYDTCCTEGAAGGVSVEGAQRGAASIAASRGEYEIKRGLRRCIEYATWVVDDVDDWDDRDDWVRNNGNGDGQPSGGDDNNVRDVRDIRNIRNIRDVEHVKACMSRVFFKSDAATARAAITVDKLEAVVDDVYTVLAGRRAGVKPSTRISLISDVFASNRFPELRGDEIIQIGTTFHINGHTGCCYRHIVTLGSCAPVRASEDARDAAAVTETHACDTEPELLAKWVELIQAADPDVLTGFNIFGFDLAYMHARARECGPKTERLLARLGRLRDVASEYREMNLSSSALGDNVLKYVDMQGRTSIDIMKVVQRDHKLDNYKLDTVAKKFMGSKKHDITAQDIFRLQRGSAEDRRVVAEYCLQDCALCNRLMMRLEIIANNMGMANVCSVPLAFIFMRGQGVKVFSLVARQCRQDGFLIPTVRKPSSSGSASATTPPEGIASGDGGDATAASTSSDSYEGAIVLEPKAGMYLDDPVTVVDYASLYPSSMISENISHDCLVLEPEFGDVPGVAYENVTYDTPDGPCTCRFAQTAEKGVLPRILMQLLRARKSTRKRIPLSVAREVRTGRDVVGMWNAEDGTFVADDGRRVFRVRDARVDEDTTEGGREGDGNADAVVDVRALYGDFQKAVLDGLQNAYKVTANSLYGQMGATTSPLYLKHIAACTTATGRNQILKAKDFMERHCGADIIYGDTDSLFMIFDTRDADGNRLRGKAALAPSMQRARDATRRFKPFLKPPHDLEYEKTFWPFIIFSKKRYVGNLYEDDVDKCSRKEMGIVLKRRDNAPIVKTVYGGIIDIVLNNCDITASVAFLRRHLADLIDYKTELDQLVVTKTLGGSYKDPEHMAHWVLAQRIGEREPGNKPQTNDRIPYIYVDMTSPSTAHNGGGGGKKTAAAPQLQGDRIEDPTYVRQNGLTPDVGHYITNQIMNPVLQLYSIVLESIDGYKKRPPGYWEALRLRLLEESPDDEKKAIKKYNALREKEVKQLLFDPYLRVLTTRKQKMKDISSYFRPSAGAGVQMNGGDDAVGETDVGGRPRNNTTATKTRPKTAKNGNKETRSEPLNPDCSTSSSFVFEDTNGLTNANNNEKNTRSGQVPRRTKQTTLAFGQSSTARTTKRPQKRNNNNNSVAAGAKNGPNDNDQERAQEDLARSVFVKS